MFRSVVLVCVLCIGFGCDSATQEQAPPPVHTRIPRVEKIEALPSTPEGWTWKIMYDDDVVKNDVIYAVDFIRSTNSDVTFKKETIDIKGKVATVTMKTDGGFAKSFPRIKKLQLMATIGRSMAQYDITVSPFFLENTGKAFAKKISLLDAMQRGHKEEADDGITVEYRFTEKDRMSGTVTLTYKGGPYESK